MTATEKDVKQREQTFVSLYKEAFPPVAAFVAKHGGSLDDARDVFHDALTLYYEKYLTTGQDVSNTPYLLGISRHLWYKHHRDTRVMGFSQIHETSQTEVVHEEHLSTERLLCFLESAGQRCLEILRAFYYDKLSMARLSVKFGFKGERSATVQKYKCLEKVREQVKQKNMSYEDFFE